MNFIKIEEDKIFFNGEQLNATSIMTNSGSMGSNFLQISESLIQAYKQGEINTLLGYLTWNISNGANFYSICIDENNNKYLNKGTKLIVSFIGGDIDDAYVTGIIED